MPIEQIRRPTVSRVYFKKPPLVNTRRVSEDEGTVVVVASMWC